MRNSKFAPTATDATERSVLLARGFLVHRIETRKHKGCGEPFAIDLAVKLTRRFIDSEPLEPQRQLLVAELRLVHLRHDEFPRLLLPLAIDILRLRICIRSFAHYLLLGSFSPSRPLSALALRGIQSYTRESTSTDTAASQPSSPGPTSRGAPC
jgi:hypothetical protein